jgi:hypothetical protein
MKAAIRRSFGTAEKINIEEHEKPVIKDNTTLAQICGPANERWRICATK